MIAVIEAKHRCVWGVGKTAEQSWEDARDSIASKIPEIRPETADLSIANIAPEAELEWDGLVLWQWVIQEHKRGGSDLQAELF